LAYPTDRPILTLKSGDIDIDPQHVIAELSEQI